MILPSASEIRVGKAGTIGAPVFDLGKAPPACPIWAKRSASARGRRDATMFPRWFPADLAAAPEAVIDQIFAPLPADQEWTPLGAGAPA
jgi:hypothetical protein